jgi:hypothetical protein
MPSREGTMPAPIQCFLCGASWREVALRELYVGAGQERMRCIKGTGCDTENLP